MTEEAHIEIDTTRPMSELVPVIERVIEGRMTPFQGGFVAKVSAGGAGVALGEMDGQLVLDVDADWDDPQDVGPLAQRLRDALEAEQGVTVH